MTKFSIISLAIIACSTSAFAQVSGSFDLDHPNNNTKSQTFTNNGFSIDVSGLSSHNALNENSSVINLNASKYTLKAGHDTGADHGIGTGPFSDGELRNGGAGLSGATLIELSNLTAPNKAMITAFDLVIGSADYSTHEGFLIYGSNQDAFSTGHATLTLLDHGFGNKSGIGSFDLSGSDLAHYKNFYVTADNGCYSSVLVGSGSKAVAQSVPEPASLLSLLAGVPILLRRRRNK